MPGPISAPQKDGLEEIDLKSGGETLLTKPKREMGAAGDSEAVYVAGAGERAATQPFIQFNVGKMHFEFTQIQVYSAGAIAAALLVIIITIIAVSSKSSDGGATVREMGFTWFERGPLAEVPDQSWREVGEKLQQLKEAHVRGVFVGSALTRDNSDASLMEFRNFAANAGELGIRIIASVVCDHVQTSHDWFVRSERREPQYDGYFVWVNGTRGTPPNNWKIGTSSAWSWSDTRGAYYLHGRAADTADLNLRNPVVRGQVGRWLGAWMRAGAAGVRLPTVPRLLADEELGRATWSCGDLTCDQPDLGGLLAEWRDVVVKNKNNSEAALFTVGEDMLSNGTLNNIRDKNGNPVVDIPCGPVVRLVARADAIVQALSVLKSPPRWPSVKLEDSPLMEESWMVGLMLPAAPTFSWEQIAIMSQNMANGRRAVYESALSMRERMLDADLSARYGYDVASIDNEAAVFSRWRGDDGYVVAVRPQVEEQNINLQSLQPQPFPKLLTAALLSSHYDNIAVPLNSTVKSESLFMVEQCAIILSFKK